MLTTDPVPLARIDLHTHSSRSDGLLDPSELVCQAQAAGLDALALTDHDSVAGVAEAAAAGARLGLLVIPGVEVSVSLVDAGTSERWDEHLLGLLLDPTAPDLLAYLAGVQESRVALARETLASLERLGAPLDPERVARLTQGAVVTRAHIARALLEAGYVATEQEAFERYLGPGRPSTPTRPPIDAAAAVEAVRAAGGVVGLAHPIFASAPTWAEQLASVPRRLDRLATLGVVAVECTYPDSNPAIAEHVLRWTHERGLIATGGSDYHGPGKAPFAPLGQVAVGPEVLEALQAAR